MGRGRLVTAAALAAVLLLAACSTGEQSTLNAAGSGARRTEGLWWLMFWVAMGVFAEVMAMLGWALWRRRGPAARVKAGDPLGPVTVLGVALPLVILVIVWFVGGRGRAV